MSIVFATASQLAQMIRDREVSTVEVLAAYLEQIEKHNSKLNAIATLDRERAITRAKKADEALARGENWGALHGVPVTIKDTFETAGLLTTAGYKPLRNHIPSQDATVVARLRQAGAIILGKSNLAEMASDFQSTNDLFGRVNNPWNLDYTPGGSSGGSAAAIAAGFSALDLGNDVSGSTRQPAHFCGVFALKPTDRRLPTTGHIPEAPGMPIDKHNSKLNAIATLDAERAITRAKEADEALARGENWGALHGVPITNLKLTVNTETAR